MNFIKKYSCILQTEEKDCGIASIATIAKQYGLTVPMTKLNEIAKTDLEGTSVFGVVKALKLIGFDARAVKASKSENIYEKFPTPAIALTVLNSNYNHYIVIHKVTKKEIIVADPSKGIVKYTPENFMKIWRGILILAIPSQTFKKGNEQKGSFWRFIRLIKTQKSLLINIFIASILVTLLGIIGSFYFQFLIDDILPNNLNNNLFTISIAMIILAIFKIITEFFRGILITHMSQNIDILLLLGSYNHIINLPMNFFATRKIGDIISRFNDASKIRDAISSATLTLMIDTIMSITGGIILYLESQKLFFICFIPIVCYLILVFSFKTPLYVVNRDVMESNSKLTSYLVESIEGIETVKAYNAEEAITLETEKNFSHLMKTVFKYSYINNFQESLKNTVKYIFAIVIVWIGSSLVLKGDLTIGTIISFNALLVYFIEPIERMINLQPQIQSALVASDRLGEILDYKIEKTSNEDNKIIPNTLLGKIKFKNVNFAYGARQFILNNINIDIKPGEKVALVGESGSGKTTIAKLLMNFYDVEKGEIIISNYNIRDINKEVLRDKIAYISQDSFFFSSSIRENLEMANYNATFEDIIDACKKAQIHDYINSMPNRYDTILEENGGNLSGGQRQRLAIARALIKKPEILIMDEATSNLDSITEKAIEKTISKYSKNVTTIIITHRLSTIMECDNIYVMEKGNIIEEGNHISLLKNRGYYYKLWSKQSSQE